MAGAFTVALVGFSESESSTFESFFRLAARRPPAYHVQDEVLDAQILIVNSDNAQAVHLVRQAELSGRTLLVGHSDAGTGWPLQRKPVKLVGVLAALDELVGVRQRAAPVAHKPPVAIAQGADRSFAATVPHVSVQAPLTPRASTRKRSPNSQFLPTRPMVRPLRNTPPPPQAPVVRVEKRAPSVGVEKTVAPRSGVMGVTDFGGLDVVPATIARRNPPTAKAPSAPVVKRGDLLLVAESLVEGRILHKRFSRYGLRIDWSREASQALALLKEHPYKLVAIDRLKGEPDAYSVCRSVKQRKLPNGKSPVVLIFASAAGSMDRIKAGLAGCDAYLSRSVGEADFYKVLADHRLVVLDGFEKTNVGF